MRYASAPALGCQPSVSVPARHQLNESAKASSPGQRNLGHIAWVKDRSARVPIKEQNAPSAPLGVDEYCIEFRVRRVVWDERIRAGFKAHSSTNHRRDQSTSTNTQNTVNTHHHTLSRRVIVRVPSAELHTAP